MLAQLKPDICDVSTGGYEYSSDHYAPTMLALEAGCHVLGEKPISNEIAKAEEMVALAKAKNLRLWHQPQSPFHSPWLARPSNGSRRDGWVDLLFVNMSMWIKNPAESSPWFQIKALHPHTIDVMRYFCGDITHGAVFRYEGAGPHAVEHGALQHEVRQWRGRRVDRELRHRARPSHGSAAEVAGTGGRFVLDDMFQELTLYPGRFDREDGDHQYPLFGPITEKVFPDTFKNRIHRFVEQISEGCAPDQIDGSGADGLAAQKVLAAAIRVDREPDRGRGRLIGGRCGVRRRRFGLAGHHSFSFPSCTLVITHSVCELVYCSFDLFPRSAASVAGGSGRGGVLRRPALQNLPESTVIEWVRRRRGRTQRKRDVHRPISVGNGGFRYASNTFCALASENRASRYGPCADIRALFRKPGRRARRPSRFAAAQGTSVKKRLGAIARQSGVVAAALQDLRRRERWRSRA